MANADIKVVVKKTFGYRGTTQPWSNAYHANGGVPADNAHWDALFDAIVAAEKAALWSFVTITEVVGYIGAGTVSAHSKSYATAGTVAPGAGSAMSTGDTAALVRYATAARTIKGHPVYLFNYYHGAYAASTNQDTLAAGQKTALETYASAWLTGFSDGAITYVRAGPRGANATARTVSPWLTHRDFPR